MVSAIRALTRDNRQEGAFIPSKLFIYFEGIKIRTLWFTLI
jgi:hypothetical protein